MFFASSSGTIANLFSPIAILGTRASHSASPVCLLIIKRMQFVLVAVYLPTVVPWFSGKVAPAPADAQTPITRAAVGHYLFLVFSK